MRKCSDIFIFLVVITAVSCNNVQAAGFWAGYKQELQKEEINDQGPWGGHRAISWESEDQGTFEIKRIIDLAEKNGRNFVDSSEYNSAEINGWSYFEKPIFPLDQRGFNPLMTYNISTYEYFPRRIVSDATVLKFKTGWISIERGTDESNEVNGFI